LPFLACVLEVADQFLFLGIDGNDRVASRLVRGHRLCNVGKLGISIFVLNRDRVAQGSRSG
jgi:hypothetical protein